MIPTIIAGNCVQPQQRTWWYLHLAFNFDTTVTKYQYEKEEEGKSTYYAIVLHISKSECGTSGI